MDASLLSDCVAILRRFGFFQRDCSESLCNQVGEIIYAYLTQIIHQDRLPCFCKHRSPWIPLVLEVQAKWDDLKLPDTSFVAGFERETRSPCLERSKLRVAVADPLRKDENHSLLLEHVENV